MIPPLYPLCCFYEPLKEAGGHIWKHPAVQEEGEMLTGTNFLQKQK